MFMAFSAISKQKAVWKRDVSRSEFGPKHADTAVRLSKIVLMLFFSLLKLNLWIHIKASRCETNRALHLEMVDRLFDRIFIAFFFGCF